MPVRKTLAMFMIRTILLAFVFGVQILIPRSFTEAQIYVQERERAHAVRFENELLLVKYLKLGELKPGENEFRIQVTNKSNVKQKLILHVQARPGLSAPDDVSTKSFQVEPGKTEEVSCVYHFQSLSPFGKLVVKIAKGDQQDAFFYEDRFHVGAENPSNKFDLSKFGKASGPRLKLYYLPGTLAASHAQQILSQRQQGISRIEKLIGVTFQGEIDIFLYPDMEKKKADTFHTGEGWAFDGIMVEVYNSNIQLDPFHEIAHIITNSVGTPPAMFDEGFAVYAAETLGADALEYLGAPGRRIDDVTHDLKEKGVLIPLSKLLSVSNIGDTPETAEIQYPQSASLVRFIIHHFGTDTFRAIFSSLRAGSEPEVVQRNISEMERITGKTIQDLENTWLESLSNHNELKKFLR